MFSPDLFCMLRLFFERFDGRFELCNSLMGSLLRLMICSLEGWLF